MKTTLFVPGMIGLGTLLALTGNAAQTEPHKAGSSMLRRGPRLSVAGTPGDYYLERRVIADAVPKASVWDLQWRVPASSPPVGCPEPSKEVFESLRSKDLRSWVDALPAQSHIEFAWIMSGADGGRAGKEIPPALRSELDDFARYCKSRDVTFEVEEVAY